MNIKLIKYFLEVTRIGSFTGAAKKLYISVPGLVKSISKLEEELGAQLIVRSHSGITLTPAGQMLARYAQSYIRQHEKIRSEVKKADSMADVRVELCMTWGILSYFPKNFLSKFVVENPDVSMNIQNDTLEGLHTALLEYRAAVGMYFGQINDPAIKILFSRATPLHALMSAQHPLARQKTISMGDLTQCKIIVSNNDPEITRVLKGQLEDAGCVPQIVLDHMEWSQIIDLVVNAGYMTFCLPPRTAAENLRTCPIEGLELTANFHMAMLQGVTLSRSEQHFVDYVIKIMRGH